MNAKPAVTVIQLTMLTRFHQQFVDGIDQNCFIYGFGDITIRPLALSPDLVCFLVFGSDQDDRNVAGASISFDHPGGLKTVESGHYYVHQNKIGKLVFRGFYAICAVGCGSDLVTVLGKNFSNSEQLGW